MDVVVGGRGPTAGAHAQPRPWPSPREPARPAPVNPPREGTHLTLQPVQDGVVAGGAAAREQRSNR